MMAVRPNLFIVGAPKCGTTAWVEYLSHHRDVFFSAAKEPHYFNTDIPGFRWFKDEASYLELFQDAGEAKVIGEASILYLYSREAAAKIAAFAKDPKILIFTRDPVRFITSYHQQLLYNRDENCGDLERVWQLSGQRSGVDAPPHCRDPKLLNYKLVGMFGQQAKRYVDRFGPERVRIVPLEDWTSDPRETYVRLMQFLDIRDDGREAFPQVNAAHHHKSELLADMTQRPPTLARKLSRAIRAVPGLQDFRPAHLLRRLNKSEGYSTSEISPSLKDEIAAHFADDQIILRDLVRGCGLYEAAAAGNSSVP